MKFVHISDLHLGKRVNDYSMHEDQVYILDKITDIVKEQKPDGIIIAGDIYDKPVPPAESVALFDRFLVSLQELQVNVFAISGNHDSPERIAFGSRIMSRSGIYLSPVYNGKTEPVTLSDEYGETDVFLLPFIKPSSVRRFFPDDKITSYTDAVKKAIEQMPIDENRRNVLVAHQLVTGAERSDSEEISIGGTDDIDRDVFKDFDYVALGHIHRPQNVHSDNPKGIMRYCGSPLKYSFSEIPYEKSVTVITMLEKGNTQFDKIPLVPLRDMREIKGTYDELMSKDYYDGKNFRDDYLHITLTNEEVIPQAARKLSTVYSHIMKVDYDNARTHSEDIAAAVTTVRSINPLENFAKLYKLQQGTEMSDEQTEYVKKLFDEIESERKG